MRLAAEQCGVIRRAVIEAFGAEARVYLFGSRLDDRKRGGDIDLLIDAPNLTLTQKLDARLRFLVAAKRQLGERRIDLVFAPQPGEVIAPIQQVAQETGVPL